MEKIDALSPQLSQLQQSDKIIISHISEILTVPKNSKKILIELQLKWPEYLYLARKDINRILYTMEKEGKISSDNAYPPNWRLVNNIPSQTIQIALNTTNKPEIMILFIDVDTLPCLDKAVVYCADNIKIYTYASPAYNHYKPVGDNINIEFYQVDEKMNKIYSQGDAKTRDAVKALYCMKMTTLALQFADQKSMLKFVVVSKDKSLHSYALAHKVKYGINYEIITDGWNSLRELVE